MTPQVPAVDDAQTASTSPRSSQSKAQRVLFTALAFVAPMSSPNSHAEQAWLRMFPQSSTVSLAVRDVRSAKSSRAPRVLPSTAEQLTRLQTFFALSKTQLAQVCGVQRQTIYDWFAGNFEAEGNNARRVAQLFGIAREMKAGGAQPLSARDLARALSDGTTILSLLAAADASPERVGAGRGRRCPARKSTFRNRGSSARTPWLEVDFRRSRCTQSGHQSR